MHHFFFDRLTPAITPFFKRYVLLLAMMVLAGCAQNGNTPTTDAMQPRPVQWATPINAEMNLFQVDENLYRSEQPIKTDAEQIKALGIKTIVNLRGFHSDDGKIDDQRITLVHIPIHTWHIRDQHVISALDAIQEARQQGPVLLHCLHGADRTGLVSAMYRMIYQGWSKEEALDELRNGGFGFHTMWRNITQYIEEVDLELIKQQLRYKPVV